MTVLVDIECHQKKRLGYCGLVHMVGLNLALGNSDEDIHSVGPSAEETRNLSENSYYECGALL